MGNSMRFFDTHAHIGLIDEDPIEQLIISQEARHEHVDGVLSICNNVRDFFDLHANLKTAPNVYFAVGVSPSEVTNPGKNWESEVENGASLPRVVAIGETGLDYFRKFGNRDSQIELFVRQLEIAAQLDKPVVIHNREAGTDILDILRQKIPPKGSVLHCYSENWEYAKKALELPVYISFAGNVTYRNARNLHETAKNMPLDRMLVESESPFMVPAAYRGQRNRPSYLPETVRFLADLREMDHEELATILFENSCRFFGVEL